MPTPPRSLVDREIHAIGQAFAAIGDAIVRLASAAGSSAGAGKTPAGHGPRPGKKLRLSPARKAALKLQGQYMGYLRNLRPAQKAQVKKLREAKGTKAAIQLAKRLGGV